MKSAVYIPDADFEEEVKKKRCMTKKQKDNQQAIIDAMKLVKQRDEQLDKAEDRYIEANNALDAARRHCIHKYPNGKIAKVATAYYRDRPFYCELCLEYLDK